jgi:hypothetical protein
VTSLLNVIDMGMGDALVGDDSEEEIAMVGTSSSGFTKILQSIVIS